MMILDFYHFPIVVMMVVVAVNVDSILNTFEASQSELKHNPVMPNLNHIAVAHTCMT